MSKLDAVRAGYRASMETERGNVAMAFGATSVMMGFAGPAGKAYIPDSVAVPMIGNVDTDTIGAVATYLYQRRGNSKNHQRARGAMFAFAGGALRDMGSSLAGMF